MKCNRTVPAGGMKILWDFFFIKPDFVFQRQSKLKQVRLILINSKILANELSPLTSCISLVHMISSSYSSSRKKSSEKEEKREGKKKNLLRTELLKDQELQM